jgi:hypothetical protein
MEHWPTVPQEIEAEKEKATLKGGFCRERSSFISVPKPKPPA